MAKNSSSIKLDIGTIYKKTENGNYFFRYQINGQRKAVSLKNKNKKEAIAKAQDIIPIAKATTTEVISVHVQQARNLTKRKHSLFLSMAREKYKHNLINIYCSNKQLTYIYMLILHINFYENNQSTYFF